MPIPIPEQGGSLAQFSINSFEIGCVGKLFFNR